MKKEKGASLVQYGLIIALVSLAAIPVLTFLSAEIHKALNNYKESYEKNNVVMEVNTKNTINSIKGGSYGGTANNPIKMCSGSSCNIDFGEFILTGVPNDFSEYVSTSGTSGATEKLSDLAKQIALQLAENGMVSEALDIKKLATIGHNIATIEKSYEAGINACNFDLDCARNFTSNEIPAPSDFDTSYYTSYPIYNNEGTSIPDARNNKLNNPEKFQQELNNNKVAALFVDKYDSLMNNNNISNATKAVLTELYYNVGRISEDVYDATDYITTGNTSTYSTPWDPFTAQAIVNDDNRPENPLEIFNGYNPSNLTHLDSALICASGNYTDVMNKCH